VKVKGQGQACAGKEERKAWNLAGSVGSLVGDPLVGSCHGRKERNEGSEDKARGKEGESSHRVGVGQTQLSKSVSQFHSNERYG
jgi:hypothetical protein